ATMTGPEKIYSELTSGNLTTISTLESDVHLALLNLDGPHDHIRFAADVPNWDSPSASTQFNMQAWATRALLEVGIIRLNRVELVLQRIAADYAWMVEEATRAIEWWREAKTEVP